MPNNGSAATEIIWAPQAGPQKSLIDCPIPEILYGGARGGGKTDGILGKWAIKADRYGLAFNGVFFRKEMPQQDDLIERAKEIYCRLDSNSWHEQKKLFVLPGGGRVRFRPLENVQDAEKYQGQNVSDAAVEEAGNYPDSAPIDRLFGCLRSKEGVPAQLILTANPGGPGHHWIKDRYIDPAPKGNKILVRKLANGATHNYIYIPSRLMDNKILLAGDPEYANRLYLVGNDSLVKAWLDGDWSVIAGAFFPEFSLQRHVIKPIALPDHWTRFRAMDWGSAKPFSVGWYAVSDGELTGIPRGCIVKYREWYGAAGINIGLKMTAEAVADGILERENEKITYSVLDPAAFAESGGPSIAERMADRKVYFDRADNRRIGQAGAMGGWDQLRARLKGNEEGPGILLFDTCVHTIRTLPALQHDTHKPEDVDTDAEDHAGDEVRYACMSRPYQAAKPEILRDILAKPSLDELWEMQPKRSGRIV